MHLHTVDDYAVNRNRLDRTTAINPFFVKKKPDWQNRKNFPDPRSFYADLKGAQCCILQNICEIFNIFVKKINKPFVYKLLFFLKRLELKMLRTVFEQV